MDQEPPKKSSKKSSWKQFQKLSFDSKKLKSRAARVESATTKHAHRFIVKRLNNIRYVRSHVLLWFAAVGAILIAVAGQFVVGSQGFTQAEPIETGTYAEGVLGAIDTLNPLQASTSAEVAASRLLFSSLYTYDKTGTLHPDVASSLSVDKSGEVYTVKLRDDVRWHDGKELTADDVVFTINLITDPETRSRSSLRTNWRDITVEKLDTYTVKFTLPAYAAFPHALTFPIVPQHVLQDVPAAAIPESSFASEPIGSGPFSFRLLQNVDIASNHRTVHMVANEAFYGRVPKISRFELHAYPDTDSLQRAIESRAITAAADVPQSLAEISAERGYTTQQFPVDNGVYLLLNTTSQRLEDRDIRRALQRGIDRDAVRQAAGEQVPALDLPFIPSTYFNGTSLPDAPKLNLKQANDLLDKAGYKRNQAGERFDGDERLTLSLSTIKTEQFERVTEVVAEQIRQLGIQVEVTVIDDTQPGSNFRQDILQQRNYDMLVYELPIGADPDVYAYWHSSQLGVSGYNFTNYSNSVSDAALASARDRTDPRLRRAKYVTFAKQWLSDAPAIGLYQQVSTYVYNPNATAIPAGSTLVMSSDRYSSVSQWTVSRGPVYKTP